MLRDSVNFLPNLFDSFGVPERAAPHVEMCQRPRDIVVEYGGTVLVLLQKFVRGNVKLNSYALPDFLRRMVEAIGHNPEDRQQQRLTVRYGHGLGCRIIPLDSQKWRRCPRLRLISLLWLSNRAPCKIISCRSSPSTP
jgi:hypothetical protein